ncbi:hypothetical protein [Streptomyces sp. NRRL S-87]|uniref:hypothetical protein n=1 Tax=Streptomyces sp. NRRL S-87 TaxID=1463920 RepID=UPI0004BFD0D3|nr:hypothetical protein [Streptomyces sp. NRRL S-87]
MASSDERGSYRIGSISGSAVNFGQGGTAHNTNNYGAVPGQDPAHAELLRLVRELREDLGRVRASEQTRVLDGELAGAQEELESAGEAGPGRLARLRDALTQAAPVVDVLASGAAVAASVAQLLGG